MAARYLYAATTLTERVLLVTADLLWPARSGVGRRAAAIYEALAADLDLAVFVAPRRGETVKPPGGAQATVVTRTVARPLSALRIAVGLARGRPLAFGFYRQRRVRRALRNLLVQWQPCVIVAIGPQGYALVGDLVPASRLVLDLADVEHERLASIAHTATGLRRVQLTIDGRATRRWLRQTLPHLAFVSAVSEADASAYRELAPGATVIVAPNGVAPLRSPRPDPGDGAGLFIGLLDYEPNREAITYLVNDVVPRLRHLDALRVVGHGRLRVGHPKVLPIGFVDDLATEWAGATCLLAPIRGGGGTRIKIIEALGAGVPVVATTFAASGIGAVAGTHYLAGDTTEEFVAAADQLLSDPEIRARLSRAGRALVDGTLTWRTTLAPFVSAVSHHANRTDAAIN